MGVVYDEYKMDIHFLFIYLIILLRLHLSSFLFFRADELTGKAKGTTDESGCKKEENFHKFWFQETKILLGLIGVPFVVSWILPRILVD